MSPRGPHATKEWIICLRASSSRCYSRLADDKRLIRTKNKRIKDRRPSVCFHSRMPSHAAKDAPQQQPFSFFFFEAFKAFLELDLSFFSFLPEALALPGDGA